MLFDNKELIIKKIQNIKKKIKNIFLKYLDKLFLNELIINNIATIETPRSDKNGPVISKAGIKIIMLLGIVSNKNFWLVI